MRQLAVFAGCAILAAAISGCQKAETKVETVVAVNCAFPDSLAGRWTNNMKKWEFVFEPGGEISSAIIDSGMIRVDPRKRICPKEVPRATARAVVRYGPRGKGRFPQEVLQMYCRQRRHSRKGLHLLRKGFLRQSSHHQQVSVPDDHDGRPGAYHRILLQRAL